MNIDKLKTYVNDSGRFAAIGNKDWVKKLKEHEKLVQHRCDRILVNRIYQDKVRSLLKNTLVVTLDFKQTIATGNQQR